MNIDPKLAELLHKVRKGSTSDMRVGAWEKVLTHLGYRCKIVKDRNTAVEFRVVTPDGTELLEIKEPGYRWITTYDMVRHLNERGLKDQASAALGIDPAAEAREREAGKLYKRDLVNTGTCGVCHGNYKRNGIGQLVKHGYQRPGHGYLVGECFGVDYQPWEISKDSVVEFVRLVLRPHLERAESNVFQVENDMLDSYDESNNVWRPALRKYEKVWRKVGRDEPALFARLRREHMSRCRAERDLLSGEIEIRKKQIAEWKPDELPEVKHAGKYRGSAR